MIKDSIIRAMSLSLMFFSASVCAGPLEDALRKEKINAKLSLLLADTGNAYSNYRGDDSEIYDISERAVHMIKNGGDPGATFSDRYGVKHCSSLLSYAVRWGMLEVVQTMLDTKPDFFSSVGTEAASGNCKTEIARASTWNVINDAMAADISSHLCTQYCSKKKEQLDEIVVLLVERGAPLLDKERLLVAAAQRNFTRSVKRLAVSGVDLNRAIKMAFDKEDVVKTIAAEFGQAGQDALNAYQDEKRKLVAESNARAQQTTRARERQLAETNAAESRLAGMRKKVGNRVCMRGSMVFGLINVTVKGFVETVSGEQIQIRIADTGGQNMTYQGISLRTNLLIWDRFDNWLYCAN